MDFLSDAVVVERDYNTGYLAERDGDTLKEAECDGDSGKKAECDGDTVAETECDGDTGKNAECNGNTGKNDECDGNTGMELGLTAQNAASDQPRNIFKVHLCHETDIQFTFTVTDLKQFSDLQAHVIKYTPELNLKDLEFDYRGQYDVPIPIDNPVDFDTFLVSRTDDHIFVFRADGGMFDISSWEGNISKSNITSSDSPTIVDSSTKPDLQASLDLSSKSTSWDSVPRSVDPQLILCLIMLGLFVVLVYLIFEGVRFLRLSSENLESHLDEWSGFKKTLRKYCTDHSSSSQACQKMILEFLSFMSCDSLAHANE